MVRLWRDTEVELLELFCSVMVQNGYAETMAYPGYISLRGLSRYKGIGAVVKCGLTPWLCCAQRGAA